MQNTNRNWVLIGLIIVLVVIGGYYLITRVQWGVDNDLNGNTPDENISIENEYDGKIVYGSNLEELDEELLRQDCSLRGGQFEICGDTCSPEAVICTELCAYTCLLPEDKNNSGEELSFEWSTHQNSDLEFSAEIIDEMEVREGAEGRIEFMYLGPTQTEGTEIFDGVRILVSRLEFNESQSLEEFAQDIVDTSSGVGEIVENVRLENDYEFATYTFTISSLGVYKHYISLIYPGEAFDISVFVSDQKYQVVADRFLNTFTITDPDYISTKIENLIEVSSPKLGQSINSPLEIEGMASGTWFFEASFSAVLTDWDGLIIGNAIVETSENWMTEEMIPFTANIEFNDDVNRFNQRATLILQKANPSGLPENEDALEFPVYIDYNNS